jgi:hypothetical protein
MEFVRGAHPWTFEVPLDIRVHALDERDPQEPPAWIRICSVNGGSAFEREIESSYAATRAVIGVNVGAASSSTDLRLLARAVTIGGRPASGLLGLPRSNRKPSRLEASARGEWRSAGCRRGQLDDQDLGIVRAQSPTIQTVIGHGHST